ncbi:MAG: LysM domain-containing protein [Pseudomonadota bacterium]
MRHMKTNLFLAVLFVFVLFSVGSATGQNTGIYKIEKGDTLWGICNRFFNDPWLWPNLWKHNQHIKNPNLILPGEQMELYVGEEAGSHKHAETTVVQTEPAQTEPAQPEPVVTTAASSAVVQTPLAPSGFEDMPVRIFSQIDMNAIGFISNKRLNEKGTIIGLPESKQLVSVHDMVFIEPDKKTCLMNGTKWAVWRPQTEIVHHPKTGEKIGLFCLPVGKVEIIRGGAPASGRIITAYKEIAIGDQLMPLQENAAKIVLKPCSQRIEATIVKVDPPVDEIAQYNIVYIDKGRTSGIESGNSFEILRAKEILGTRQEIVVGELVIIRTEEETAAALVTRTRESFSIGEKVRAKS